LPLGERETTEAILRELAGRFARAPRLHEAARLQLARLLVVLERTDEAQHVLSTLSSTTAVQLRARAHFVAGDLAAAEALTLTLVNANDRDVRSLALLAQIAFAGGKPGPGVSWLTRALEVDPHDAEALSLLNRIEAAARHSQVSAPPGSTGS
jgi:Flp pilus assembly protein TadD